MPTYDEMLLETLRKGRPPPVTTPGMPEIQGRPDINQLLSGLATVSNKPIDLSGIERVARARTEGGKRNFLAGAILSGMGGEGVSPLGKALAVEGLEQGRPLRLNTADEALIDPSSGQAVVNPLLQQKREDAQRQAVAQALIREQLGQAGVASKQTAQASTDVNADVSNLIKALTVQVAQQNAESNRIRAEAQRTKAENAPGTKPLTGSESEKLRTGAMSWQNLDTLEKGFKDEYAGGWTGTKGAEIQNYIASNFPKAMEATLGPDVAKKAREQAEFWRLQKYYDELPNRHELFGATLTGLESASWKSASIQPGMDPKDIRANLRIRKQIWADALKRERDTHIANRKHPEAVEAALKGTPAAGGGGGGWTVEEVK